MEEMKKYILGDVCSRLSSGKGISSEEVFESGPYPVIGGNGLRGYSLRSNFSGECGVIGRQGAYCGNVRFFSGEAYMTEHAVVVVGNEKADTRYLTYLLSTMHLGNLSAQSAQPGLSVKTLAKQEIVLPSFPEQKRRASILASLEDKIDLNNRINHNLEEQAQALYKSWFVDFEPFKDGTFVDSELGMIPEGWTIVRFLDIAKLCSGGTPKTDVDAFWDGSIPFFTPKDVKASPFCLKTEKYITEDGLKHCNSQLYDVFTTFITARGTVGKLCMAGTPMAMNHTNYAICSKTGISPITLYLMSKQIVAVLKNKANGAVFDAITTRDFEGESIVAAPTFVLDRFAQIVRPIFDQILQNEKQTLTLIEQRDSVLPKLMSGRIDSITC